MSDLKRVAIVGVPNSGKSSVFNKITKEYSMTANYPYTTVKEQRARIKIKNEEYEFIDTPGINSLDIFSEDELLVRDLLIKEKPSLIIQCVDAVNLKRSLLLTAQLIELDIPLMICLNFVDEAQTRGIWIDSQKLENVLKVPVVETVADEGRGIDELINRISRVQISDCEIQYPKNIRDGINEIQSCFPNPLSLAVSLLILSGDSDVLTWIETRYGKDIFDSVVRKIKEMAGKLRNVSNMILNARNAWAEDTVRQVIHRSRLIMTPISEKIGELTRHPIWGWPILAGVLYITYYLVAKVGAVEVVGWLDDRVFSPLTDFIAEITPWQFLREFLVGEYGILSIGVFAAIGTVLPILIIFFFILSFLEDIGYITNLCVLTNHFLKKIGLSGKAILPLTLGFGCKTMATLTTKILDSWKERYIAIFLIAFCIPCSAQLGLNLAILAFFPFSATLIVLFVLIIAEVVAGAILDKLIKSDKTTDFILEIPPIRFPNLKNLLLKMYYRMKSFSYEALPLFLIGAAMLFSMEKLGALLLLRKIMSPVVESFLSLPIETLEGFVLCLVRHEQGAAFLMNIAKEGGFSYINVIVCIIVVTGFIPCLNNIAAIAKQLKIKSALLMVPIITVSAILVGGITNWFLRLLLGN